MRREETTLPNIEFTTATGNYDESRLPIDTIVIHSTVGTVQSAINRFGTRGTKVSAHYIIGNDGKLYQGLEEYYTAYHCGNYNINQRSIGIEHEWYKGITPSDALYETSAKLVADICKFYKIPCDRKHIKKHSEIVPTACPNEIDVERIVRQARQILGSGSSSDYYLGIDLNNKESVKVCVEMWHRVVVKKEFIEKKEVENNYVLRSEYQNLQNQLSQKDETIKNLNQQIKDLNAKNTLINDENRQLKDQLKDCQTKLNEIDETFSNKQEQLLTLTQELNQLKLDYENDKKDWGLKEINYQKQIKTLQTKYDATKSSIKKLLIDYIFGKK